MRFPTLSSIRSNDSTVRQYDSFGDEDDESLPPPPPPLSTPPSPQADPSSQAQWSPDDVSAMTVPSGLGTMSNVEALETNDRNSSKESQGEQYVDGFPPSTAAAVELELAIYERLEKARKVENDLARDEQNRRDSRKRGLCAVAVLLLAVLALSVGLAQGLNQRTVDEENNNSIESTPSEQSPTNDTEGTSIDSFVVETDGPFIHVDLSIMLVGLTSPSLSSTATHVIEQDYCAFFSDYYNNPRERDWLRSNVDIAECSVEALETNHRRLNDSSANGLIVELNQTLTLEYPNAGNFTYIKASMDYVVSAPFKDEMAVASLVEKLQNKPETDDFSDLKDIRFAPEPVPTTDSQAPVSMPPEDIVPVPTTEPSKAPFKVPTTLSPTENPTAQPTNLPRKEEKGKDKDKKKNTKGKV